MPVSRDGASEMKCGKDALHVNRVHGNGKPVKGKEKKKNVIQANHTPQRIITHPVCPSASGRKERNATYASKQSK